MLSHYCSILFNNSTSKAGTAKMTSRQEFCLSNKCYTNTEFILYGLGTVLLGVIGGVAAISYARLDQDDIKVEQ